MANIAQLVNVLQSVILTEGSKMVLTPTYHVFNMYKYHQDAQLLESSIESEKIGLESEYMVPNLQESVSMSEDGRVHITLNNLSVTDNFDIDTVLTQAGVKSVKGTLLTDKMDAFNDFENPEQVKPAEFSDYTITESGIRFSIPACSVLHLEIELN